MRLRQLADLGTLWGEDVEVKGICYDSRRCRPGDLFVAIRGAHADGRQFIAEAVAKGAVAVVSEQPAPALAVPQLAVGDARAALPEIANRFYDRPASQLKLIGVTGTNGKSTVAFVVAELLKLIGQPCGLIGTVQVDTGSRSVTEDRTTPEAPDLCRYLREMVDNGLPYAAMEVSSHALALQRVQGLHFAAALFTNLTRDHLDFHGTMEAYGEAKARLFRSLAKDGLAVLNRDDPAHRVMAAEVRAPVVTYGVHSPAADFRATHITLAADRTEFVLSGPSVRLEVRSRLIGRFNVSNLLGALTLLITTGQDPERLAGALPRLGGVPGRFERVDGGGSVAVVVDYAHTPDGLEKALAAAREVTSGRVIVVVGCGGDRDRGKRAPMGQIATSQADLAILTSDNPRSEDPLEILAAMEVGASRGGAPYRTVPDRRLAIAEALASARAGDLVLIAGKGHEAVQVIGERSVPFDDRQVARELMAQA